MGSRSHHGHRVAATFQTIGRDVGLIVAIGCVMIAGIAAVFLAPGLAESGVRWQELGPNERPTGTVRLLHSAGMRWNMRLGGVGVTLVAGYALFLVLKSVPGHGVPHISMPQPEVGSPLELAGWVLSVTVFALLAWRASLQAHGTLRRDPMVRSRQLWFERALSGTPGIGVSPYWAGLQVSALIYEAAALQGLLVGSRSLCIEATLGFLAEWSMLVLIWAGIRGEAIGSPAAQLTWALGIMPRAIRQLFREIHR